MKGEPNMMVVHFKQTWPRRRLEWLLSIIIFGLGVVYTISDGLFEKPFFASMAGMMPQRYWALFCLTVGGTRLAFLFINGSLLPVSPAIRCAMSAASSSVWTGLVFAAVLNPYAAQMLAFLPPLLFFEWIVTLETAREWGASLRVSAGDLIDGTRGAGNAAMGR